ncbi:MAG: hypothetical protein ACRDV9_12475 [Acidimicrobiia bacterium]
MASVSRLGPRREGLTVGEAAAAFLDTLQDAGTRRNYAGIHLPGRDYLLFEGPLTAASEMGHWPTPTWFLPQSPNLFWPHDRAWCVASEIDFDSTLVGGNEALIEEILHEPSLEAWRIRASDSLAWDGDILNT